MTAAHTHVFVGPHPEVLADGTPIAIGALATPDPAVPHDAAMIARGWLITREDHAEATATDPEPDKRARAAHPIQGAELVAVPDFRVIDVAFSTRPGEFNDDTLVTFTVAVSQPGDADAFELIGGARRAVGGRTTVVVHKSTIDGKAVASLVADAISNEEAKS